MSVYEGHGVTLHHGDCLDVLRALPDASVDAVVTDPPYGLEFMGKAWDSFGGERNEGSRGGTGDKGILPGYGRGGTNADVVRFKARGASAFGAWCELWAVECLRVLKPGGHLLAFGGTRTWHRLACAVEDAGFEVRDSIAWLYGSGFPKSLDVSKAIDKAAGAEREVVGMADRKASLGSQGVLGASRFGEVPTVTAPATPDAERWQGWGTALKPAFEPIVVARKPLTGTVAANVLSWGTGALNVDGCRIEGGERPLIISKSEDSTGILGNGLNGSSHGGSTTAGRWPANVVLDESQAEALDEQSGESAPKPARTGRKGGCSDNGTMTGYGTGDDVGTWPADAGGGASRFFYVAKAPKGERPSYAKEGAGEGRVIEGASGKVRECRQCGNRTIRSGETQPACGHNDFAFVPTAQREERVSHPTVKPLDLMRWLVRLVTPPGGVVLEPFAGSGTTVEACIIEGFDCIAIEKGEEYLPLIMQRIHRRRDPVAAIRQTGDELGLFELDGEGA